MFECPRHREDMRKSCGMSLKRLTHLYTPNARSSAEPVHTKALAGAAKHFRTAAAPRAATVATADGSRGASHEGYSSSMSKDHQTERAKDSAPEAPGRKMSDRYMSGADARETTRNSL